MFLAFCSPCLGNQFSACNGNQAVRNKIQRLESWQMKWLPRKIHEAKLDDCVQIGIFRRFVHTNSLVFWRFCGFEDEMDEIHMDESEDFHNIEKSCGFTPNGVYKS